MTRNKFIAFIVGLLTVVGTAKADVCGYSLVPTFTPSQANKLCAIFGTGFNQTLIPATNNTYDLGSTSKKWRSAYFGTNLSSIGLLVNATSIPADVTTAIASPSIYNFVTSADSSVYLRGSANAAAARFNFAKSRATDGSGDTIVSASDKLGEFNFYGSNGTDFSLGATMVVTVDGTPGATNDMPSAFDFQVSPDGSATPASVLKLANDKSATFTGTLVSTRTSDIGWSIVSATNQACNTTCTNACVVGQESTSKLFLSCSDATADICICAGAS